jgi:sulfotransferase
MQKKLHFLSGLQRSGSTVLTKVLNQHPDLFASSTSPFLDYLLPAVEQLYNIKQNHSSGHYVNVQKILSTAAFAFYDTPKSHIIDKNRGWLTNYENIDKELQQDPKIILTLRPIDEVVASFYKILVIQNQKQETPETIFEGYIKELYFELMKKAYLKDKICIVTYKQITKDAENTMSRVENFLNVDHHKYDFNNIRDDDPENDEKWGIPGLHSIRQTISVTSIPPSDIMTKSEIGFCKQLTDELYRAYDVKD